MLAIEAGWPLWASSGEGGDVPRKILHNFVVNSLKDGARMDFWRGTSRDDFVNKDWERILGLLHSYRRWCVSQRSAKSPESLGNCMEAVVGISYAAATNSFFLTRGTELRFPSDESHRLWANVYDLLEELSLIHI